MAKIDVPDGRWISTVRLGPKSQIVIPKEAREMFDLDPGDTLLLMADRERGIALVDPAVYAGVVNKVFGVDQRADESPA